MPLIFVTANRHGIDTSHIVSVDTQKFTMTLSSGKEMQLTQQELDRVLDAKKVGQ